MSDGHVTYEPEVTIGNFIEIQNRIGFTELESDQIDCLSVDESSSIQHYHKLEHCYTLIRTQRSALKSYSCFPLRQD